MHWMKMNYYEMTYGQKQMLEKLHEFKNNTDINMTFADNQVRNEFLRRDFTKRQMNIITLIYNFSYGFGKKWALIPKMKDFELCGVSALKIRKELEFLEDMFIIEWNQEENLFRIKDPKEWLSPPNNSFSYDRSHELIHLNLKHGNII